MLFSTITINRDHAIPLARQLYMQLHQQILQGSISYKELLPATRTLASELQISRGVVIASYEMLKADGLISGFGKGGTQVSYRVQLPDHASITTHAQPIPLSARGGLIANARQYSRSKYSYSSSPLPLTPSVPDFSLFPYAKWQQLSKEALNSAPAWYQRDGGLSLLKENLKNYLEQYRGIYINNLDCLLITTGAQSALSLLTLLLTEPGDSAVIDQPCWSGLSASMKQAGLNIIHAPIDEQGTRLDEWKTNTVPKIVMVTPSCQFPTGCAMSMERREALIRYTAQHQAWIIEDDYASEYSYAQHPAPSILAHSATRNLIHIGTMSKLLLPSLRLGWMVVPQHLARDINSAINTMGIQPPYMIQHQLGNFMQYGYLSAHLSNTRVIYNERRRLCSEYLHEHGQDCFSIMPSTSGMNHYLKINKHLIEPDMLKKSLRESKLGCDIYIQAKGGRNENYLLLGHANLHESLIEKTLSNLLRVCRSILGRTIV